MLKTLIPSDDPLLHRKIKKCSYDLDRSKLSYTLTENMFHHNGVGLSANQIGIEERAFVMMINLETQETITCFNPHIIKESKEIVTMEEGCLSYPDLFSCGVAGGPVTDWSLDEVMYTERYMETPLKNPDGYNNTNLNEKAQNLSSDLLMIHGLIDDVVVVQHSLNFLEKCVDDNIPVDYFLYPNHPHNIRGKDRLHLMEKVLKYIIQNNE